MANLRRNNPEKYFLFASHFIAPVVGKKKFNSFESRFGISKYVSVSDEAFALLVFENNYDRWMSMAVSDNWASSQIAPE